MSGLFYASWTAWGLASTSPPLALGGTRVASQTVAWHLGLNS